MKNTQRRTALAGAADLLGSYRKTIDEGWRVVGLDCISEYYVLI